LWKGFFLLFFLFYASIVVEQEKGRGKNVHKGRWWWRLWKIGKERLKEIAELKEKKYHKQNGKRI
jgi:hypothetical protein